MFNLLLLEGSVSAERRILLRRLFVSVRRSRPAFCLVPMNAVASGK
jgi:hypothetical protein